MGGACMPRATRAAARLRKRWPHGARATTRRRTVRGLARLERLGNVIRWLAAEAEVRKEGCSVSSNAAMPDERHINDGVKRASMALRMMQLAKVVAVSHYERGTCFWEELS